ncbi:MAG: glycosyltransferase family 9 protein, partial [Pirellulaceae bacterium]|nr:glycosyltransferase family 9 protein [Pirellulaceae bacterium]
MSDEVNKKAVNNREDFKKILIVRMSSLGDVLFALPSLEALRLAYPKAHIAWIVEDRCAGVLENHPLIDEVIVVPRRQWRATQSEGGGRLAALGSAWRFFRELRKRQFDLSIDFQANIKSGMATLFARAPVRLGFARSECREPNWLFTNRRLDLDGRAMHRVDRDLELLSLIGVPSTFTQPTLAIRPADVAAAKDFVGSLGGEGPIVMLQPGTSSWGRNKRWSLESFAALGNRLAEQHHARVIVNWGNDEEREQASRVIQLMQAVAHPAMPTHH